MLNSTTSNVALTSTLMGGILDDDFMPNNNQMIAVNTFTIPLYTPIFIQNKSDSKYLSVPNQLSSLLSTKHLFKSQLDLLMSQNVPFGLITRDLTPPGEGQEENSTTLVDSTPPSQSYITDLVMSDKPNIKFIYSGESNFHIIESKADDFLYINHHVLDCKNNNVFLNVLNDDLSQKWHIGKCNSTPTYCIIRSIENPKLKLYYDGHTVYLREEIDNVAELNDGFLWKFILQEIPQYKYVEKLHSNEQKFKSLSKNRSKLYMTVLPNLQLELSFLNSILTGIFLTLNNVGNTQYFRITNDGVIESKVNSTDKDKASKTKMVVTWDLEENKIVLAKNENLQNQKWIFVPHNKNHNLFIIHSVHDPIYILHTYRLEKHSLLCIKELESDSKEDYYWLISE